MAPVDSVSLLKEPINAMFDAGIRTLCGWRVGWRCKKEELELKANHGNVFGIEIIICSKINLKSTLTHRKRRCLLLSLARYY